MSRPVSLRASNLDAELAANAQTHEVAAFYVALKDCMPTAHAIIFFRGPQPDATTERRRLSTWRVTSEAATLRTDNTRSFLSQGLWLLVSELIQAFRLPDIDYEETDVRTTIAASDTFRAVRRGYRNLGDALRRVPILNSAEGFVSLDEAGKALAEQVVKSMDFVEELLKA